MTRVKLLRSRELRARQTRVETQAWQLLYGFIVDFYCAELRLAIELDGEVHDDPARQAQDGYRDAALAQRGIRVIRLQNREVSRKRLIMEIRAAQVGNWSSTPNPRPPSPLVGEGDRG